MAASFTIQTQHQTVQILGESTIRDVMEIGFTTVPSGVYAVVEVPLQFWRQFGSGAYVEQVADLIEAEMGRTEVVAASYSQDVDDAGLLKAYIDFVVQIIPPHPDQFGPMQAIARVPLTSFTEPIAPLAAVSQPIDDAIAALELTAGQ
jgi:hypothetical protein